jgi:hypothetical protein
MGQAFCLGWGGGGKRLTRTLQIEMEMEGDVS